MSQTNNSVSMGTDTNPSVSYRNYINDSVDPGNSLLIATVIFCLLLLLVLPCMVWVGIRFRNHEATASEPENASETINGGGVGASFVQAQLNRPMVTAKENTKKKKRRNPRSNASSHDKHGECSVEEDENCTGDEDHDSADGQRSEDTGGGTSVASALMNAFLFTSPHGGGIKRHHQLHAAQREEQLEKDDSVDGGDSLPNNSVLGRLSQDEVSIQDAVDAPTVSGHVRGRVDPMAASTDHSGLWYLCFGSWFYPLLSIADYDYETKRLVKLGGPFVMQALLVGIMSTVRVALIGKFIGTAALSAYVVVELAVGTTDVFLLGLIDACVSLCSQAIGAGNKRLAGQYIQIATILYILCYIPIFILWMFLIGPLFSWLGFDGADDGLTREIGEQFTILYLFYTFIKGVNTSSHALLDVIGKENYSTAFVSGEQIAATLVTLVAALQPGVSDLNLVGLLLIAVQSAALILNSVLIAYNGWFDKFLDGLVGSFALLNFKATKLLVSTSLALAFGSLLAYGAWEVLTIFASFLGPAEVATWGLLGTLWDALEIVTEAVADAGEVRTAFLLGAGKPVEAKISSYKSLYLGTMVSILITACMFIAGESIPTWLTNDPTLQRMTSELIPLFGIGNIALSIGTLSWTLVGAQGRFRLSTAVGLSGGWFVAMPMAALLTLRYNVDLQGQTAAVVVGYMVSGTINSYILLQSDWPKLSRRVIERSDGISRGSDDGGDDSSSSSDSSPSDSDSMSRR